MSRLYRVILKRHEASTRPNVCAFYDEDRETAIKAMKDYVSKHGFTIDEMEGTFTIADVLLSEETYTGEVISQKPWRMIFDIDGKRIKEVANGNHKDHNSAD